MAPGERIADGCRQGASGMGKVKWSGLGECCGFADFGSPDAAQFDGFA